MALDGFDPEFRDFPDYILRITERIWEGRDVGAIHRYYAPDCVVHTGLGSSQGVAAVVAGTLHKQHQFPDRLILGEDVIWSGTPADGLLSSHRSMMVQTHAGFGALGAPTGRRMQFRAIADCAARDNMIYEEWLVVDQSAAVLQAGLDPLALARGQAMQEEASNAAAAPMGFSETRPGPDTRILQSDPAARLVRDVQQAIWTHADLSVLPRCYDRAVNVALPGGAVAYGTEAYGRFLLGWLSSFPDAALRIEHSVARHDPGRPVRVATRWTLSGTHAGPGAFGAPSVAQMFVLGITHSEVVDGRIMREWVAVDEMAIWQRIARALG